MGTSAPRVTSITEVWESVRLSLPLHLQDVARNIELLCKCEAAPSLQIVDNDSDDDNGEDGGLDDVDEAPESNDQCVDLDTLINFSLSSKVSGRDADNIPSLRETDSRTDSELEEFTAPLPDDARLGSSPDFQRISPDTLPQWAKVVGGAEPDGSGAGQVRTWGHPTIPSFSIGSLPVFDRRRIPPSSREFPGWARILPERTRSSFWW